VESIARWWRELRKAGHTSIRVVERCLLSRRGWHDAAAHAVRIGRTRDTSDQWAALGGEVADGGQQLWLLTVCPKLSGF
jgi:hypothetical protein